MKTIILMLAAALTSGCLTVHPGSTRPASPPSPETLNTYSYPKRPQPTTHIRSRQRRAYRHETLQIPLSLPDDVQLLDQVSSDPLYKWIKMERFVPNTLQPGDQAPTIIISPILGGPEVVDLFAKYYAKRGFITVLVHRKKPEWFVGSRFADIETHLRIVVLRLQQVVDWLETQPQVDRNRIGTFGISYGAIVHTAFAAIDDRPQFHVLCFPGAPIGDVLVDSHDPGIKARVAGMTRDTGLAGDQLKAALAGEIKTAPELLAQHIDPERVVIYLAAYDMVVKTEYGRKLWAALGKPELRMTPFGHYTSAPLIPIIQAQTLKLFEERLQ